MMLLRVLHAEALKMKRTVALKLVVVAPAAIVLLILFLGSQAPFTMFHRDRVGTDWLELERLTLKFWALLMMPLYITLETALLAGLDHSGNQWKSVLARPVPRWTLYVTKLIVAMAMTAGGTLVLLCGILFDGAILPRLQPELVFGSPIPWTPIFRDGAQIVGLAFLALAIQHWVSLRCRSFPVAIGTGIVATVVGIFAAAAGQKVGGLSQYFPWSLPMLVLGNELSNVNVILLISGGVGIVVAAAGCLDFSRREVH